MDTNYWLFWLCQVTFIYYLSMNFVVFYFFMHSLSRYKLGSCMCALLCYFLISKKSEAESQGDFFATCLLMCIDGNRVQKCDTANIPGIVSYTRRLHRGHGCRVRLSSLLRSQNSENKEFAVRQCWMKHITAPLMRIQYNFTVNVNARAGDFSVGSH